MDFFLKQRPAENLHPNPDTFRLYVTPIINIFPREGEPIHIDEALLEHYRRDEQSAVVALTETLASALQAVTLNAPDWRTLRLVQTARRLYKPAAARLTPREYIELNRRFVNQYLQDEQDPELTALVADVEDSQAQLDLTGFQTEKRPIGLQPHGLEFQFGDAIPVEESVADDA